jgi:hypothetical protein
MLAARPIARSPVGALDDAETVLLGAALELEVGDVVLRWGRGATLLWWPKRKALLILEGIRRGKKRPLARGGRAPRDYERWSQATARNEATAEIPDRGTWVAIDGPVKRLDYASKKWGGTRHEYTHTTGRAVRLYRYGPKTRPPWCWVVRGGRLTVTERGIVN